MESLLKLLQNKSQHFVFSRSILYDTRTKNPSIGVVFQPSFWSLDCTTGVESPLSDIEPFGNLTTSRCATKEKTHLLRWALRMGSVAVVLAPLLFKVGAQVGFFMNCLVIFVNSLQMISIFFPFFCLWPIHRLFCPIF